MDEKKLAESAAGGDQKAFEQLVLQYQKPVYNLALRMAGNADDAFDLAQEAFLRAWRALPQFKFESSFSTWLYRLTSNVCIDFLRQKKRSKVVSFSFVNEDDETEEYDRPDPAPGPEARAIASAEREEVARALDSLEPEYREALTLCAIHGMSYIEIAEVLDVPAGTVKSRISRAREKMRRKLQSGGNKSGSRSSTKTRREADAQ
jgi:RNA polymerase sigma-70 factor, ECF subfamily